MSNIIRELTEPRHRVYLTFLPEPPQANTMRLENWQQHSRKLKFKSITIYNLQRLNNCMNIISIYFQVSSTSCDLVLFSVCHTSGPHTFRPFASSAPTKTQGNSQKRPATPQRITIEKTLRGLHNCKEKGNRQGRKGDGNVQQIPRNHHAVTGRKGK